MKQSSFHFRQFKNHMTNVTSKIEETFQVLSQAVYVRRFKVHAEGLCSSLLNLLRTKQHLKKCIQAALNQQLYAIVKKILFDLLLTGIVCWLLAKTGTVCMKYYINVFKYKDKYSFTNFSRVLSHQLERIMALNDATLEPN